MNSVNTSGSVSTSIRPPCCLTMMSCVIERPSPVPSPVGLVVKNGIEHLFPHLGRNTGAIVANADFDRLPRFFVVASSVGSKAASPILGLAFGSGIERRSRSN